MTIYVVVNDFNYVDSEDTIRHFHENVKAFRSEEEAEAFAKTDENYEVEEIELD